MRCKTPYCRRQQAADRNECHKCRSRKYRERNPLVALYHTVKSHAKQRGIGFFLTCEQFKDFCHKTGYHLTKGRTADAMSIDRIRGNEPYQVGNIQLKTVSQNSIKSWYDFSRVEPDEKFGTADYL